MTLQGVDVSSFQGTPRDWEPIAGKIDFAAVKFSELGVNGSRFVNPDAAADWSYLKAHGKGRIAYLFGHPGASATASAALFISEARKVGLDDGDAVALDLEVTDGRTAADVSQWARDVAGLLHRDLRRKPLVYTFISFAEAGNCAGLGHYPLWIADPSSLPGHPRVPAPWRSFSIHQWKITGPIDRDVADYPDLAAMRRELGVAEPDSRDVKVKADGHETFAVLARKHGVTPAGMLRRTAVDDGKYPADVAAWLNKALADSVPPEGTEFRAPAHLGNS